MQLATTVFEISSGQTYIRKYPIRISGRMSGRIIGLSSNFHQYFKLTFAIDRVYVDKQTWSAFVYFSTGWQKVPNGWRNPLFEVNLFG